ncbi:MAG: SGNH/GDSL hydrolase family protein [archaeon]
MIHSFTYGGGYYRPVNEEQTYPWLAEEILNNDSGNRSYVSFNFAVQGYNTLEEVDLFFSRGMQIQPDIIVIGYYSNDWLNISRIKEIAATLQMSRKYQNLLDYFKHTGKQRTVHNSLVSESRHIYETEVSRKPFSQTFRGNVELPLERLRNATNASKVILVAMYDTPDEQRELLRKTCDDFGWTLIDLAWMLEEYEENEIFIYPEIRDSHPSPFAHQLIARAIFDEIIRDGKL